MAYLDTLLNLKNKVAVVIGGGGHLCSAMALALAKADVKVVVADLRLHKANTVVQKIKRLKKKAVAQEVDVTNKESLIALRQFAIKTYGKIDILINGAGTNAPTPFLDISLEEWNSVFATQITATMLGCQVFGEYMVKRKKGSIINISSASANPPLSKAFTYSVAKAGIKNLTQNLAREWATSHVRVNALRPGFFPTAWSQKNFIDKKREKAILGHTPMGRYGKPEELAGAVLWLASDASGFVTGSEVAVDGGFSCMTI